MGNTLFGKIWDKHVVKQITDGPSVLYIDKHFIHEVTSPQAFSGIEKIQRIIIVLLMNPNFPTSYAMQMQFGLSACKKISD